MNIRCIALDLDRSTLNAQGKLSPGNREALLCAMEQGVHIVIASGRSFHSLPPDVTALPGIEYAITGNGSAVYRLSDGALLHRFLMTPASIEAVLQKTASERLSYEAFVDGHGYAQQDYIEDPVAFGATEAAVPYIQSNRLPVDDIKAFIREHIHELTSLDLVLYSEEQCRRLWQQLQAAIPELYITSSVTRLLELSHKDGGKHAGLRFLAERLGLQPQELAAFGDGDNDADMLRYVGCGIAVENATPACKAAADHVTLHHDQDGVAYGIHRFLHL